LAVALPPAINLNRNADADFIDLFRRSFTCSVAVTRSCPYAPEKGALGPGWLSVTATPPPVQQKTLLASTAFFASLGVFIVGMHTNALRLFAHFFGRMPGKFI